MKRTFVYTNKEFYWASGTVMSSIYEVTKDGQYFRSDWGKLQVALANGDNAVIRQSTPEEVKMWKKTLEEITRTKNCF